MPCYAKYLLLSLLATLRAAAVLGISCAGCVDLDELNFDNTIIRFPYALVKFDIAFPYGDKHEAFSELSKAANKASNELLIATVGIKDYGEMENKALGERFNVNDKQLPSIVLYKGSIDKYLTFPAHLEITLDNLKQFINDNTQLYLGRDGCLKQFHDLVKNYANLDKEQQLQITSKAQELYEHLAAEEEQLKAKNYLLFMAKITEKGYDFVEEETKRLLRLRAAKVSKAKKAEISEKLNVIDAFRVHKLTRPAQADAVTEAEAEAEKKQEL